MKIVSQTLAVSAAFMAGCSLQPIISRPAVPFGDVPGRRGLQSIPPPVRAARCCGRGARLARLHGRSAPAAPHRNHTLRRSRPAHSALNIMRAQAQYRVPRAQLSAGERVRELDERTLTFGFDMEWPTEPPPRLRGRALGVVDPRLLRAAAGPQRGATASFATACARQATEICWCRRSADRTSRCWRPTSCWQSRATRSNGTGRTTW